MCDPATGQPRQTLGKHRVPVRCVVFSPDGTLLAAGDQDWRIKLWDLRDGCEVTTLVGHLDTVASLAFAPDGRTLASGSWDGTVRLWNLSTGQEVGTLEGHTGKVHAVAFSPDGMVLASGGESPRGMGELYLWRAPRGSDGR